MSSKDKDCTMGSAFPFHQGVGTGKHLLKGHICLRKKVLSASFLIVVTK